MDNFNLMEFDSPEARSLASNAVDSPGSNPFDTLSKLADRCSAQGDAASAGESVFKAEYLQSLLKDLDLTGRESLGILKLEALNTSFTLNALNISNCVSALEDNEVTAELNNGFCVDADDEEEIEANDECFNDSIFIEAHHLASKIEDGSILLENSNNDGILDNTNPPNFDFIEQCENGDLKVDAETIFKTIDKMLPPLPNPVCELEKEAIAEDNVNSRDAETLINCDNQNKTAERKQSSGSDSSSQKLSMSRISNASNDHKSRDANELLQDLSVIINDEQRDVKLRKEGQQLLSSLANILSLDSSKFTSPQANSLEDSGHSSIEQEDQQNEQDVHERYEILDLRLTTCRSDDSEQVLDLSLKSKTENPGRRFSQSFTNPGSNLPCTKLFDSLKSQRSSKSSISSLEMSKDEVQLPKLKPKKTDSKGVSKKGPLKAVIPLGNMAKQKNVVKNRKSVNMTPSKSNQIQSSLMKANQISTPISESKPVAQSTPDGLQPGTNKSGPLSCSSQLRNRKFYCPISPLVKSSSIAETSSNVDLSKSNRSGSAPNLSDTPGSLRKNLRGDSLIPSPKVMLRRHSASELKIPDNVMKLRRSNSSGKVPRPKSFSGGPVQKKEFNRSSKCFNSPVSQKPSTLQEKNGDVSKVKSFGLLNKLKKSGGKENVLH